MSKLRFTKIYSRAHLIDKKFVKAIKAMFLLKSRLHGNNFWWKRNDFTDFCQKITIVKFCDFHNVRSHLNLQKIEIEYFNFWAQSIFKRIEAPRYIFESTPQQYWKADLLVRSFYFKRFDLLVCCINNTISKWVVVHLG